MWATKKTRLKSKNLKRLITGGAKIIILSFLISTLRFMPASALTSQSSTGFQFSFNSSLSITLSSSDLIISHLTPGNYASSNTITVNVATNNSYGYTLIAKVGDKDNPSLSNNNLVNTESSDTTFTSLSTNDNITLPNFNDNKWGYTTASTIDTNTTTYSGLLYNADTVINATKNTMGMPQSSAYPGTNNTSFTIAARAGDAQASGEYTNVINFRSVANVSTDLQTTYMQDLSTLSYNERQELLNYMVEGTAYQLKDSRDDTIYNVAKLKDGNIWMLDNLALDLTNSTTLNNTTASNTNASSTTLNYLKNGGGTTSDKYATASVGNLTSGNNYSVPLVNANYKDQTQPLAVQQPGTGKIGVYYNYCAASAGSYCYGNGTSSGTPSGNATEDICPKGWRLPTGGASGEFQALRDQYSSDGAMALALRTPFSGYFYDSTLNQGSNGRFWSSTYRSAPNMYGVSAYQSGVNPQHYDYRLNGFSLRCIFGSTMQNITTSELATIIPNEGNSVTLLDTRDGTKYTVGKLADGRYWMLDNLALGGTSAMTLTNSDTNMTASSWTLPASISSGFKSYTVAQINTDSKSIT